MNNLVELTVENFKQEVYGSDIPVLVDFWAPWCSPCLTVIDLLESILNEKQGGFKLGKVNVDEQPSLATEYGIRSIPYLILVKNGEIVDTLAGAQSKSSLLNMLKSI